MPLEVELIKQEVERDWKRLAAKNQVFQEEIMYLKMKMEAKEKDAKKMEKQYNLMKQDWIEQNKNMRLAIISEVLVNFPVRR